MAVMTKYPIGIQSFEKLRDEGCLYIDKTQRIRELVERGCYYFLSRPRRFGKSLLLSTIKAYFEGRRDLFRGLAIDTDEVDWTPRPVLHLDLNAQKYDSSEKLDYVLDQFLGSQEEYYGIKGGEGDNFGPRFQKVIQAACQQSGHRVIILIDEYDKPMLQAIGTPELQGNFRSTLKGFYGALKSMDNCIQFAMLTGVTKFGKVSVFSDLNHLSDISMDRRYYDICGITQDELDNLGEGIGALAKAEGLTTQECTERLREQYDGYHFTENTPGIYNPFSLLNTLDKQKFSNYWFQTGTPEYLATLLKLHDYNLENVTETVTDESTLNSIDSESTDPIPVIYQSGYLTIKDYDPRFRMYTLGFPNKEVEEGFIRFLVPHYTSIRESNAAFEISRFVDDVENGRTEQFIARLRSFFADTPYELIKNLENHYQNVLFIIARLMGFYTKAEYHTSEGRIDMVIQVPRFCYVLEFKINGSAEEALQQIQDKSYPLPFLADGRQIIRIGMNFSSQSRNIDGICIG